MDRRGGETWNLWIFWVSSIKHLNEWWEKNWKHQHSFRKQPCESTPKHFLAAWNLHLWGEGSPRSLTRQRFTKVSPPTDSWCHGDGKTTAEVKTQKDLAPPLPPWSSQLLLDPPPLFSRSERHRARGTLDLRLDLNPECVQRQLGVFLKADYQGGGRTFAGVSAKFLALSFYSSFLMCYMETPHFSLWDENTNYYVPPSLKCHKLWNSTEPHLHLLHIWILFFAQSIWTKSEIQLTSWVFCEWAPIKQLLLGDNKGLSQNRSFFPSCAKKKRNKVANRQKWVSSFFGAVGCFVRGESCSLCSNGWRA